MNILLRWADIRFQIFGVLLAIGFNSLALAENAVLPECVPVASGNAQKLEAPVRPPDCAVVEQTPPDFSWPAHGVASKYRFALTFPDGKIKTHSVDHNWIAWPGALAPEIGRAHV